VLSVRAPPRPMVQVRDRAATMRTCVRMMGRPWRPDVELDAALERGELGYATALAEELKANRGRPIPLETAVRFLPLIAVQSPGEFDAWAVRWLTRWLLEAGAPTVSRAAEVVGLLVGLAEDPTAIEELRTLTLRPG
jgi:hypothetical protein